MKIAKRRKKERRTKRRRKRGKRRIPGVREWKKRLSQLTLSWRIANYIRLRLMFSKEYRHKLQIWQENLLEQEDQ